MFKDFKEIFKNLRDMQDQLWKDSMANFPGSAFPRDLDDWQRKTLENMTNWAGQAVKQSLELQRDWLNQWWERAEQKKLKPKSFAELSEEARTSTQRWLDNQNQLWEQWLQVLRGSGVTGGSPAIPNFQDWEKAVRDSIQRQTALTQDWSEMADFEKLTAKQMTKLSSEIVKAMQKSIETQQQLWSHWFDELGDMAAALQKTEEPATAKTEKATKKARRSPPAPVPPAQAGDDLKKISGIGPGLEKKLKDQGILTIRQIADLTEQDVADLEKKVIRFAGRIKREQWVEQARKLLS